jgi:excisionase family DNA binding protein
MRKGAWLPGRYLTTGEVAKFLGISRSTVQRYVDKGKIKAGKNFFTGRRKITYKAVTEFVKNVIISKRKG